MKKLVNIFSRETIALFVTIQIAQGAHFERNIEGLILTGIALTLGMYIVKPLINILLLPINLATLGVFRFVSHAIVLWIVDMAIPFFTVTGFQFGGAVTTYFTLPSITLPAGPLAYLGYSVILFIISSLLD